MQLELSPRGLHGIDPESVGFSEQHTQDSVCRLGGSGSHGRLNGSEISARDSSEDSPKVGLAKFDHRTPSSVHFAALISAAVDFSEFRPYWERAQRDAI
jgi:hypothetical protein